MKSEAKVNNLFESPSLRPINGAVLQPHGSLLGVVLGDTEVRDCVSLKADCLEDDSVEGCLSSEKRWKTKEGYEEETDRKRDGQYAERCCPFLLSPQSLVLSLSPFLLSPQSLVLSQPLPPLSSKPRSLSQPLPPLSSKPRSLSQPLPPLSSKPRSLSAPSSSLLKASFSLSAPSSSLLKASLVLSLPADVSNFANATALAEDIPKHFKHKGRILRINFSSDAAVVRIADRRCSPFRSTVSFTESIDTSPASLITVTNSYRLTVRDCPLDRFTSSHQGNSEQCTAGEDNHEGSVFHNSNLFGLLILDIIVDNGSCSDYSDCGQSTPLDMKPSLSLTFEIQMIC
ncbi:hypothetical protein BLNAU_23806 [Blattamonas nauphoetae]|uniref:Uncharacterized protein n=1 Tax=Blattamonas nauphoetae TaxID=2049346 RepID=A0ABQ9WP89_9EUKA|nr:hypothetical protein BLNAU_23806 [Blattamonas nauphoetae]